jgi:hypothetical protein
MQIELDRDAAHVLFELLASREERIVAALQLAAAERNAPWYLRGASANALVALFSADYLKLVQNARRSLVERGGVRTLADDPDHDVVCSSERLIESYQYVRAF